MPKIKQKYFHSQKYLKQQKITTKVDRFQHETNNISYILTGKLYSIPKKETQREAIRCVSALNSFTKLNSGTAICCALYIWDAEL